VFRGNAVLDSRAGSESLVRSGIQTWVESTGQANSRCTRTTKTVPALLTAFIAMSKQSCRASTVVRSNIDGRTTEAHVPFQKPVLAGLLASAIVYLCFLTWLHWKVVALVKEQGATGLIAVTGAQVYVLHSPAFWALAIIAFGVVFFLFRNA